MPPWASLPNLPLAVPAVIAGTALGLLLGERMRPLRPPTQSKPRRLAIALGFALTAGAIMALTYAPVVSAAADFATSRDVGLLRWARVPRALRPGLAFILLDYSLWGWHWLNHRVPLLWRFHAAHHADLDMDVLTAWRFHFGEMLASVPFRAAQVVLIGVELRPLLLWEATILVCAQFHHANVRLPASFERVLRHVAITPRLHGSHHSIEPREVSSNFGTILSVWDRLHGLHRWTVGPTPTIGLPQIRDPRALTLVRALMLPFSRTSLPVPRAPS